MSVVLVLFCDLAALIRHNLRSPSALAIYSLKKTRRRRKQKLWLTVLRTILTFHNLAWSSRASASASAWPAAAVRSDLGLTGYDSLANWSQLPLASSLALLVATILFTSHARDRRLADGTPRCPLYPSSFSPNSLPLSPHTLHLPRFASSAFACVRSLFIHTHSFMLPTERERGREREKERVGEGEGRGWVSEV